MSYNSEELLQRLLFDYPKLLAGEQINSEKPRNWLLISKEFGAPDTESSSSRWYLDHLFLDQNAIPTLVEVKRSTDIRIRREAGLSYRNGQVVISPTFVVATRQNYDYRSLPAQNYHFLPTS